jgi:tRNA (guanine37-N1)-methyltransferase
LPPADIESVQSTLQSEDKDFLNKLGASICTHQLNLDYKVWTAYQIIRAILPNDINEVTTSFETVGHIAHVNLRDSQLEYKQVIGQVLLDKNSPRIRTIVNKVSDIQETFRVFKMEILAGSDDMMATVRENGCTFTFDFSQVYWNSRLHTEHNRLINCLSPSDVVCDMFAGVGPFALPAAKKGCYVYANDLNPAAYEALCRNAKANQIDNRIRAYNLDGRDFVREIVDEVRKNFITRHENPNKSLMFTHVIMNLPAMAVQFLDVFKGLFKDLTDVSLPIVYCYCFSKAAHPETDAQRQCEHVLGIQIDATVHCVRNVAPNKMMLCVMFRLPQSIAYDDTVFCKRSDISEEPVIKKVKLTTL